MHAQVVPRHCQSIYVIRNSQMSMPDVTCGSLYICKYISNILKLSTGNFVFRSVCHRLFVCLF